MIDNKWWDGLGKRIQRVLFKRVARKSDKKEARIVYLTQKYTTGQGYCCPKCHTWYADPIARAECRIGHEMKEAGR